MLRSIQIQNYALIKKLEIDFNPGFTIITGETGAGKSILLGALSLLLGQRADTSVLLDKTKKCIVEGTFNIKGYQLKYFFNTNDIDYEELTIIRREISPSGKSRAFINDSPVNLVLLRDLGIKLVDIHSQHQNLNLGNNQFQLTVIDTVARHVELTEEYAITYNSFVDLTEKHRKLVEKSKKAQADLDYYQFQFDQLESAKLQEGELEELEDEAKTLSHAEEIKLSLLKTKEVIDGDEKSILNSLKETIDSLRKITGVYSKAAVLEERLESVYIELKDIVAEAEILEEKTELDPHRQQMIQERLDQLYSLLHKHSSTNIQELISLKAELNEKINDIASYDDQIAQYEEELNDLEAKLTRMAAEMTANRRRVIPEIEKTIRNMLIQVGIPNARFTVNHIGLDEFTPTGKDRVEFLFSANKQVNLQEISKVASGGELSRLMLSIKSLLSHTLELPTIIFDEVDAGVSGEIADKVGNIMKNMASGKQVINITHLPQVAGKGEYHYLVYKYDKGGATITDIKLLSNEERVFEIAKMLSGEELTEAAISNARELLN